MFKNWKEICEIKDTHFMWVIALLDLATDFGQMVASRFPEYFTDKEQQGPIPLSVLRMKAEENASAEGAPGEGAKHLLCYNVIPDWMPLLHFVDGQPVKNADEKPLPLELNNVLEKQSDAAIGKIYEWEGKKLVLVDDVGADVYFVPAELIAVDR